MFNEIFGTLSFLQPRHDDDFTDRFNYYYTSTFLIVMAVCVSFKMFAGRPMECWTPAQYEQSWEDYSEMFCWAQNTYFVMFDEEIPEDMQIRSKRQINYYQWAPFFFVITAFLFYLPCIIWRVLYTRSGCELLDIIEIASDKLNIQPETRESNLNGLCTHLQSIFSQRFKQNKKHQYHHRLFRCLNCRYYESYMTWLYLFVKALYCLNVFAQLFLMNRFLQTDKYTIYGFGVLRDVLMGRDWEESGNFPRVTLCDMKIRVLGNVQRHTVQCVLVINIFLEKIFIMLWIWYSVLFLVNLVNLLHWVTSSLLYFERYRFIVRRLELTDVSFDASTQKQTLERFIRRWIRIDGVLVLKMISAHGGVMFCAELVDKMWDQFLIEQSANRPERTMIFGTPQTLDALVQYTSWFGDGTFRAVTRVFQQIYSIHVRIGNKNFPAVIVLMSSMSSDAYAELFNQLLLMRPQLANVQIKLTTDFEMAVKQAVTQVFPATTHRYCYFHLIQNLWRRTQAAGLQGDVRRNRELGRTIKMLGALTFVPPAFVVQAYTEILRHPDFDAMRQRYPRMNEIIHYWERNYVGVVVNGVAAIAPRFIVTDWNCYNRTVLGAPRTNNGVEGFNNAFNTEVQVAHAEFWRLVGHIKEVIVSKSNEVLRHDYAGIVPTSPQRPRYRWLNQQISTIVGRYFGINNNYQYCYELGGVMAFHQRWFCSSHVSPTTCVFVLCFVRVLFW